jgi:hypothetical protein
LYEKGLITRNEARRRAKEEPFDSAQGDVVVQTIQYDLVPVDMSTGGEPRQTQEPKPREGAEEELPDGKNRLDRHKHTFAPIMGGKDGNGSEG